MNPANRLPTILKADAAFCLLCGVPGIVAPGWLADFLLPSTPSLFGFAMRDVMLEVGILLALYAVVVFVVSLRQPVNRMLVSVFTIADAGWVLGTVLLLVLAGGSFSLWGGVALLIVAIDTAMFGWLKLRALRGGEPTAVAA
jgi:hypothetical protein